MARIFIALSLILCLNATVGTFSNDPQTCLGEACIQIEDWTESDEDQAITMIQRRSAEKNSEIAGTSARPKLSSYINGMDSPAKEDGRRMSSHIDRAHPETGRRLKLKYDGVLADGVKIINIDDIEDIVRVSCDDTKGMMQIEVSTSEHAQLLMKMFESANSTAAAPVLTGHAGWGCSNEHGESKSIMHHVSKAEPGMTSKMIALQTSRAKLEELFESLNLSMVAPARKKSIALRESSVASEAVETSTSRWSRRRRRRSGSRRRHWGWAERMAAQRAADLEAARRQAEEAAARAKEAAERRAEAAKEAAEKRAEEAKEAAEKRAEEEAEELKREAEEKAEEEKKAAEAREAALKKKAEEAKAAALKRAEVAKAAALKRAQEARAAALKREEALKARAEAAKEAALKKAQEEKQRAEQLKQEAEEKVQEAKQAALARAQAVKARAEQAKQKAEAKVQAEKDQAEAEREKMMQKADALKAEAEKDAEEAKQKAEQEEQAAKARAKAEVQEEKQKAEALKENLILKAETEKNKAEAEAEAMEKEAEKKKAEAEDKAEVEAEAMKSKAEEKKAEAEAKAEAEKEKAGKMKNDAEAEAKQKVEEEKDKAEAMKQEAIQKADEEKEKAIKKADEEKEAAIQKADEAKEKAEKAQDEAEQKADEAKEKAENAKQEALDKYQEETQKAESMAEAEKQKVLQKAEEEKDKALNLAEEAKQKAEAEKQKAISEAEAEKKKAEAEAEAAEQKAEAAAKAAAEKAKNAAESAAKAAKDFASGVVSAAEGKINTNKMIAIPGLNSLRWNVDSSYNVNEKSISFSEEDPTVTCENCYFYVDAHVHLDINVEKFKLNIMECVLLGNAKANLGVVQPVTAGSWELERILETIELADIDFIIGVVPFHLSMSLVPRLGLDAEINLPVPVFETKGNNGGAFCSAYCANNMNDELPKSWTGACCAGAIRNGQGISCTELAPSPVVCRCKSSDVPFLDTNDPLDSRYLCGEVANEAPAQAPPSEDTDTFAITAWAGGSIQQGIKVDASGENHINVVDYDYGYEAQGLPPGSDIVTAAYIMPVIRISADLIGGPMMLSEKFQLHGEAYAPGDGESETCPGKSVYFTSDFTRETMLSSSIDIRLGKSTVYQKNWPTVVLDQHQKPLLSGCVKTSDSVSASTEIPSPESLLDAEVLDELKPAGASPIGTGTTFQTQMVPVWTCPTMPVIEFSCTVHSEVDPHSAAVQAAIEDGSMDVGFGCSIHKKWTKDVVLPEGVTEVPALSSGKVHPTEFKQMKYIYSDGTLKPKPGATLCTGYKEMDEDDLEDPCSIHMYTSTGNLPEDFPDMSFKADLGDEGLVLNEITGFSCYEVPLTMTRG